jgi:urease accessory protein UreF
VRRQQQVYTSLKLQRWARTRLSRQRYANLSLSMREDTVMSLKLQHPLRLQRVAAALNAEEPRRCSHSEERIRGVGLGRSPQAMLRKLNLQ